MIIPIIEDVFLNAIKATGKDIKELAVLELGNGIIKNCCGVKGKETAKSWWIKQGVARHVSVDINGRDGALKLDLGVPQKELYFSADLVVNLGTAEHVTNIYECFANMHYFMRQDAICVSWGPIQKHASHHSPWGYRLHFPYLLCEEQRYELIDTDIRVDCNGRNPNVMDNSLIYWTFRKIALDEFMPIEVFSDLEGFERR